MTDIFDTPKDGDQPNNNGNDQEKALAPELQKLMEIKNENGEPKYATIEKAVDALAESQKYIPSLQADKERLERELAELKAKQESQASLEDTVAKLLENREANRPADQQASSLNEESVAEIVRREQQKIANEAKYTENANKVQSALISRFGDEAKAKEEIAKKAAELGTTPEKMGALAAESPEMVLSLFSANGSNPVAPNTSTVNTATLKSPETFDVAAPEKSLLAGATAKDQEDYMKQIKEAVYKKYEVVA